VFGLGLVLRWYSIIYLGRFFTVNVAIHSGHEIIDTGPYKHIRHPSYTGALLAFLGLALSLTNWASLALVMLPIVLAFSRRIAIEETALASALGSPYINYMRRTKRLAPFIY
jgi:protein-S-isoprenylcysteine O-methyltransferase